MPWSTNPYGVPGIRTRGGVGNQQSARSQPPARGGPVAPAPSQPPVLAPNPPALRTSIGAGPSVVNAGPITAVIPQQRRRGPIASQFSYVVSHSNSGIPVQMTGYRVPPGATVRVRASNPSGGNANPIYVATDPAVLLALTASGVSFSGSAGCVLQSLDDVEFNVATTAEIWVLGIWKDGVVISINKGL